MTRVRARLAVVALAACQIAWLDPHQRAREANRLYAEGKFDDAATRYNEALVDEPDSGLLHFNLGDTAYRQGKYDDALKAFGQVAEPARAARVAYNVGNTKYRQGEAAEASDPTAALKLWAEALVAYRRALGADPDDEDARVNHELVERKIAELKKKLEEQKKEREEKQKEQEQKPEDQQPKDDQQQQAGQEQQNEQQEKKEEEQQPQGQQDQQQQQQQEQAKPEGQPQAQQAGAPPEAGEPEPGDLSKQEAAALLDSQRDQEVQPDEVVRKLQGAVVGEPAQDW